LIKEKDVIRMKVSFPSVSKGLALQAHMYICGKDTEPDYGFIKCQTLKPYMLGSDLIAHYVDESPDISRNPFGRTSRIDCDKLFVTSSVRYGNKLKTTMRPDICQELYDDVKRELAIDGYKIISINEDELVTLNSLIIKIQ
jgi:hypothetical protein